MPSSHARSLIRLAAAAILATALFGSASVASASTLQAPSDVLETVDVTATLAPGDPAGLAILFVDESAAAAVETTAGPATLSFRGIPLAAGAHRLRLVTRTVLGLVAGEQRDVVSWRKPVPPVLVTPAGGYAGKTTPVVVRAMPGTALLKVTLNGRVIGTKAASPGELVDFGTVGMQEGENTFVIEASNPVSASAGKSWVNRVDWPWDTCIVIDKSDFRLYWVRDGSLVKAYPIAIGKSSTPTPERTWRVGAKYITDWGSVYGPRKMRLFRQSGGSFEYTAYNIHGTNQEWVIGTMASHGCIRMYNRDVLELWPQVEIGTMVLTRQ